MASLLNFKSFLAAKLGEILCKEIDPKLVTVGASRPNVGASNTAIDVTYDGKTYPMVYNKFPIANLFQTLVLPSISGEWNKVHDMLPAINARFGLDLALTDVVNSAIDPKTGTVMVTMTPENNMFSGVLQVGLTWTGPVTLSPANHEWLLRDNLKDTGTDAVDLTGPITHFDSVGGRWGSLGVTGHIPFPAGAVITRPGDYTLDFKVLFASVPTYACLFSTGAVGAGITGSIWFYGGKCYEYGVSSGNAAIPAAKAGVPFRVTLVRKGGSTAMYLDGVLAQTYVGSNNAPWVGFHDTDSSAYQFAASAGLRDIRMYNRALDAGERAELFKL